jgi:hypothetical protein
MPPPRYDHVSLRTPEEGDAVISGAPGAARRLDFRPRDEGD